MQFETTALVVVEVTEAVGPLAKIADALASVNAFIAATVALDIFTPLGSFPEKETVNVRTSPGRIFQTC